MRKQRGSVFAVLLILVLIAGPPAIAQQSGYYVLDGFGGVHAGGGAPAMSPQTPYFGFDIAKDIVYVPPNPGASSGIDGVLVLDGFGGVHAGGAIKGLSIAPTTPYFGFNVARAIALRAASPPRSNTGFGGATISSTTYSSTGTVTIHAPRPGRLILLATGEVFCSGVGDAGARFSLNVDTLSPSSADYPIGILDCSFGTPNTPADFKRSRSFTFTRSFLVSAGTHTGHLLARKEGGSLNFALSDTVITVIFVE